MYYKKTLDSVDVEIELIEYRSIKNGNEYIKLTDSSIIPSGWSAITKEEFEAQGTPILDYAKQQKIVELKQQCESSITGGYQSTVILSSTGKAHIYPTDRDDQLNMSGTANVAQLKPAGTLIEFKTKDTGKYEIHTQDEIKKISIEVYDYILRNLKKSNEKVAQVMAATTKEEIDAVVW